MLWPRSCQAFPMEVSVMDLLVERVAGLDVAKDEVVAAVRRSLPTR